MSGSLQNYSESAGWMRETVPLFGLEMEWARRFTNFAGRLTIGGSES